MELGMVGLGRMGANMTRRLTAAGHRIVVFDRDKAAVSAAVAEGAVGADSLASVAENLSVPRAIWIMVPSGEAVDETIATLLGSLHRGDILVDGGNSDYHDSMNRAASVRQQGFEFLDVGFLSF